MVNEIVKIPANLDGGGNDKCIWAATSNDNFIVKSAYLSLFNLDSYACSSWALLWKLPLPPKIKTFFG